jgi:GST-like protein
MAVEMALAQVEAVYRVIDLEPWNGGPLVDELRAHNPLVQVPTLLTPDGAVLTETVAILIWLDAQFPAARLLPSEAGARGQALRWLLYLSSNVYAAIGVGDFPERWTEGEAECDALKIGAKARLMAYWTLFEAQAKPSPFLAGSEACALDLMVTTMMGWRPGRPWFEANCPKLMQVTAAIETDPRFAAVVARNHSA